MSTRKKQRLLTALWIFIAFGIAAIIFLVALVLSGIQNNQVANHNDTSATQSLIVCMLKVPVAQRTDNYANKCRIASENSTGGQAAPVVNPASVTTSPEPSTSAETTPTSTPTTTVTPVTATATTLPLNCAVNLLGLHLICPQVITGE